MMPRELLDNVVGPALFMLPTLMDSKPARAMLLAIGLQESRLTYRRQIGGPARGLWQFEQGGGCKGVVTHPAARDLMRGVCNARNVKFDAASIYKALETDDLLACCAARLLLFTDPHPLPALTDQAAAWDYYARNWRPGKPHPETWPGFHAQAIAALG